MNAMKLSAHGLRLAVLGLAFLLGACSSSSDDDDGNAQIRLLNVSPGYESLDLYVDNGEDAEELKLQSVGYNTISNYTNVDGGTYSLKIRRSGVTSTLQTLSSTQLASDSHTVLVTYGSNGRFGALLFNEDTSDAGAGESKVLLINTGEAGALDLYLTDEEVSLDDATPQFRSIAHGASTTAATVDSGTYRLRVTGAGDTSDIRLDISEVSFESAEITALVMTATQGGVLVNVMHLPQQGAPTLQPNTRSRIRAAAGIGNGTAVTARVANVSLLSNASIGVVGSRYSQVESGSQPVTVAVDGVPVAFDPVSLQAGGDYTLLVWSNAAGTQATLINDDNRLPMTSGKAKLRLVNSLSALDVPITLAVDYSPIIEGTPLGAASDYFLIDGALEYQMDVSSTNTGVPLLTRTGITLQSGGVYTMFMHGGGTTAVGTTLRKDR